MIGDYPRLAVERRIPESPLQGLRTGHLVQHGVVVRWAVGTDHGGDIVRHLLMPRGELGDGSTLVPSGIHQSLKLIGGFAEQVLQLAQANMLPSGLNLGVSVVGFAVLYDKLNQPEGKIDSIAADAKAMRDASDRGERAELLSALHHLVQAEKMRNESARSESIGRAHHELGRKKQQIGEMLPRAGSPEALVVSESCYCITTLAHARCCGELGSPEIAFVEMCSSVDYWSDQARRGARELLLAPAPERFLYSGFASDAATVELAGWLDFAHGDNRGIEWLDELQHCLGHYYNVQCRTLPKPITLRQGSGAVDRTLGAVRHMRRSEAGPGSHWQLTWRSSFRRCIVRPPVSLSSSAMWISTASCATTE